MNRIAVMTLALGLSLVSIVSGWAAEPSAASSASASYATSKSNASLEQQRIASIRLTECRKGKPKIVLVEPKLTFTPGHPAYFQFGGLTRSWVVTAMVLPGKKPVEYAIEVSLMVSDHEGTAPTVRAVQRIIVTDGKIGKTVIAKTDDVAVEVEVTVSPAKATASVVPAMPATEKSAANRFQLAFNGPFTPGQDLVQSPVTRPWMKLYNLTFSRREPFYLETAFEFNGPEDPHRKIRAVVSAVGIDGKVYTLMDKVRDDMRATPEFVYLGTGPVKLGSSCLGNLPLPVGLDQLARVKVAFEDLGTKLAESK